MYTDYDNRYTDWIPVSYELQREDALYRVKTEFDGMPNDANTKAWDDLIIRRSSWSSRGDTVVLKADPIQRHSSLPLHKTLRKLVNR